LFLYAARVLLLRLIFAAARVFVTPAERLVATRVMVTVVLVMVMLMLLHQLLLTGSVDRNDSVTVRAF